MDVAKPGTPGNVRWRAKRRDDRDGEVVAESE